MSFLEHYHSQRRDDKEECLGTFFFILFILQFLILPYPFAQFHGNKTQNLRIDLKIFTLKKIMLELLED